LVFLGYDVPGSSGWFNEDSKSKAARKFHGELDILGTYCALIPAKISNLANIITFETVDLIKLSFCVVGQPVAVLLYAIDYEFQKETGEGEGVANFQEYCRIHLWGQCLLGDV